MPHRFMQIRWIPSHLNDKGNESQKCKALQDDIACEEDIIGNDEADKLADRGTAQHEDIRHVVNAARDRRQITIVAQKMMLNIWELYIAKSDPQTRQCNEADEHDIEKLMQGALLEDEEDYDYDPFDDMQANQSTAENKKTEGETQRIYLAVVYAILASL